MKREHFEKWREANYPRYSDDWPAGIGVTVADLHRECRTAARFPLATALLALWDAGLDARFLVLPGQGNVVDLTVPLGERP